MDGAAQWMATVGNWLVMTRRARGAGLELKLGLTGWTLLTGLSVSDLAIWLCQ